MSPPVRSVCVFCGSRPGESRDADAARSLGRAIARRGLELVYGGGRVGLMGILADAARDAGGDVIGVIPRAMVEREVAHSGLTRLETTADMFERKARMMELADAFISLPGGVGTLDELFEVLTWNQLGYLAKPNALLDRDGFWQPLLAQLDAMVARGFVSPEHRDLLLVGSEPDALLDRLADWRPPARDALERDPEE